MNFDEGIKIDLYADDANKQFGGMQDDLLKIEGNFQSRMDGKSTGRLVGSFIGTLVWLAVFIVGAFMIIENVNWILASVAVFALLGLVVFMIIDNIINFSYYGKISSYRKSVSKLLSRVDNGMRSIKSNQEVFWNSKERGWNHLLRANPSIPEEAASIEKTVVNMESLKKGFINGAKNVFYYASAVMTTVAGCAALFPISSMIMKSGGKELSDRTLLILSIAALVIVGLAELLLARLVWSKTDCSVKNVTLLILAFGPIVYLPLIILATLVVVFAVAAISAILSILGTILAIACLIGSFCGG